MAITITSKAFSLDQGGSVVLDTTHFDAVSSQGIFQNNDAFVTFGFDGIDRGPITGGYFHVLGFPETSISSITRNQMQPGSSSLVFRSDGHPVAPEIYIHAEVINGLGNPENSTYDSVVVTFDPSPVWVNAAFELEALGTHILTGSELQVRDIDAFGQVTHPDDLKITVLSSSNLRVERQDPSDRWLPIGLTEVFTASDVELSHVRIVSTDINTPELTLAARSPGNRSIWSNQDVTIDYHHNLLLLMVISGIVSLYLVVNIFLRGINNLLRRRHRLADALRDQLCLKYNQFCAGEGAQYNRVMMQFEQELETGGVNGRFLEEEVTPNGYGSLATCLAGVLKGANMVQKAQTSAGLWNWFCLFNTKPGTWARSIDLPAFKAEKSKIAEEVRQRWRKSDDPTSAYPPPQNHCIMAQLLCCLSLDCLGGFVLSFRHRPKTLSAQELHPKETAHPSNAMTSNRLGDHTTETGYANSVSIK